MTQEETSVPLEVQDKCVNAINMGLQLAAKSQNDVLKVQLCSDASESPIEHLMAAAFISLNILPGEMVKVKYLPVPHSYRNIKSLKKVVKEFPMSNVAHNIWIFPQVEVKSYRVDFMCASNLTIDNPSEISCLAIECDGHEYHIQNKQQAANDRKRDRSLLTSGYPVMRFTGSEIWNDAFSCANEVMTFFIDKYRGYDYNDFLDDIKPVEDNSK